MSNALNTKTAFSIPICIFHLRGMKASKETKSCIKIVYKRNFCHRMGYFKSSHCGTYVTHFISYYTPKTKRMCLTLNLNFNFNLI